MTANKENRWPVVDRSQIRWVAFIEDRDDGHSFAPPLPDLIRDFFEIRRGHVLALKERSLWASGLFEISVEYRKSTPRHLHKGGVVVPQAIPAAEKRDQGGSLEIRRHANQNEHMFANDSSATTREPYRADRLFGTFR